MMYMSAKHSHKLWHANQRAWLTYKGTVTLSMLLTTFAYMLDNIAHSFHVYDKTVIHLVCLIFQLFQGALGQEWGDQTQCSLNLMMVECVGENSLTEIV